MAHQKIGLGRLQLRMHAGLRLYGKGNSSKTSFFTAFFVGDELDLDAWRPGIRDARRMKLTIIMMP